MGGVRVRIFGAFLIVVVAGDVGEGWGEWLAGKESRSGGGEGAPVRHCLLRGGAGCDELVTD